MASSVHPPIPEERVSKYDLTALPDPPDDYTFLNRTFKQHKTKINYFHLSGLQQIAKHFLWGYWFGNVSKASITRAIAKVNYYMRPEHQVQSEEQLMDFQRDGGPRLLRYTIKPTPIPVSRHWPFLLSEDDIRQLGTEHYSRPADAPPDVSDAWLFQFLLPSRSLGVPIPATNQIVSATDTHLTSELPGPSQEVGVYSSNFDPVPVREAIEKALIKLCYKDLERHSHAPSMEPVATRVASSFHDLRIVQVGAHPTVSDVRLNPATYAFDPMGRTYPYRGRGPIWADGSCAIDSTIVLGMLTMAGCTNVDRADGAEEAFTVLEKAFIQATNMNWDAIEPALSIELRHAYFNLLCEHNEYIRRGQLVPMWTVWAESTRSFAQFRLRWIDRPAGPCTQCGHVETNCIPHRSTGLTPLYRFGDERGVTMSSLLRRTWGPHLRVVSCEACGTIAGPQRLNFLTGLPSRLVVSTGQGMKVLNHTEDQQIQYVDINHQVKSARFRWLGGAYYFSDHIRVYWNDDERGETKTGNIRMYDGQEAGGVIVGGLSPWQADDRVPPEWVANGIPVAIYERIVDPTEDMLIAAANTVNNLTRLVSEKQPVLSSLTPWAPQGKLAPFLPLEQLLPTTGERYQEIQPVSAPETFQPQPTQEDAWVEFEQQFGLEDLTNFDPMSINDPMGINDPMSTSSINMIPGQGGQELVPFDPQTGGLFENLIENPYNSIEGWRMIPENQVASNNDASAPAVPPINSMESMEDAYLAPADPLAEYQFYATGSLRADPKTIRRVQRLPGKRKSGKRNLKDEEEQPVQRVKRRKIIR
ncbi:hypothetical protein POX_a01866 [Penicillium oxalicum]|uniref:hypothetical protein n=1 Tax=Penicillium oxalicum TaxID=69781 RepID=UPI0020B87E2E|nr:hypothetical protein POX_a01866 [Penicillium oxalicum]KAI2795261.1 hypothetical protein POX_a01866 [Penicillium oxalicum]